MISRFASAIAHETGWPPKVIPWTNVRVGSDWKGSITFELATSAPMRRIGGCDPLGQRHHVRLDPIAGAAEPVADPPEPADHLVRHQQDAVLVADLADAVEVALRRHDRTAGVLDRLEDDRGHRRGVLVSDDAVDLVRALERAGGRIGAVRAPVAVRHRRAKAAGEQGLELGAKRRATVDRQCPHRRSVVGAAPRHVLVTAGLAAQAVVLARHLESGLVGLGSARDEEDPADVDRDEVAHLSLPARGPVVSRSRPSS